MASLGCMGVNQTHVPSYISSICTSRQEFRLAQGKASFKLVKHHSRLTQKSEANDRRWCPTRNVVCAHVKQREPELEKADPSRQTSEKERNALSGGRACQRSNSFRPLQCTLDWRRVPLRWATMASRQWSVLWNVVHERTSTSPLTRVP